MYRVLIFDPFARLVFPAFCNGQPIPVLVEPGTPSFSAVPVFPPVEIRFRKLCLYTTAGSAASSVTVDIISRIAAACCGVIT
jgi:hypothetical protein